jgi:hypothetical protein
LDVNTPAWFDLLWRGLTVAGTLALFFVWRRSRTLRDPLARARLAALCLGITATAVWSAIVLNEVVDFLTKSSVPPLIVLGIRVAYQGVVYGLALLVPGWLPRLLLAGAPGPGRARMVMAVGGVTLFILAIVMVTTGMLTLWADSLREWLEGLFDVGIPVLMIALVALTMIRAVRELGGGFPPGHRAS